MAVPDWVFRVIGFAFFFGYLAVRLQVYFYKDFWEVGPYYQFESGYRLALPWTRVLVDLTCLLIALSYVFRLPAKTRATRMSDIVIAMLGGFWPMLPFLAVAAIEFYDLRLANSISAYLMRREFELHHILVGASLIIAGNALDVWGYGTLFRSFSIVPEARALKVTGPYRFVRHPIYFGQIISQTGVWMFFANINEFSIAFLATFIVIQLYRSRLEDRVLEEAFGQEYAEWKQRTFWFV